MIFFSWFLSVDFFLLHNLRKLPERRAGVSVALCTPGPLWNTAWGVGPLSNVALGLKWAPVSPFSEGGTYPVVILHFTSSSLCGKQEATLECALHQEEALSGRSLSTTLSVHPSSCSISTQCTSLLSSAVLGSVLGTECGEMTERPFLPSGARACKGA